MIKRPDKIKVFGSNATHGNYLPIKFGTNIVVPKSELGKIANDNFEFGLESLEKDFQMKDLNSVLYYQSALTKYLFERGVAEFSAYEEYQAGAVVTFNNSIWIAQRNIEPSLKEIKKDPCNPCTPCSSTGECSVAKFPSKDTGWCKLVTHCTYDMDMEALSNSITALQNSMNDFKGVESLTLVTNNGEQELVLTLSNNSKETVKLSKLSNMVENPDGTFSITNPDGTVLTLPKFIKDIELNTDKGFFYNNDTGKWEVSLSNFVTNTSGLEVDREGKIKISPTYTTNLLNDSLKKAKEYLDSKNVSVELGESSGLTGKGTADNPLKVNHSDEFKIINGKLYLNPLEPKAISDLNNLSEPLRQYGFTPFYGSINKEGSSYVVGVPATFNSEESSQNGTTGISQLTVGENYDFNGWQLASKVEVQQFISNNGITWERTNDFGMNSDGTLINPSGWSNWKRSINANIAPSQINNLIEQLRGLTERVSTAEQANQTQNQTIDELKRKIQALEMPCEVTIKNVANHTVTNEDNVIVSNGGTITFPNNLKVGRSFTVIRNGSSNVTLEGITAQNGKVLTTDKTAVTVVVIAQGVNMAFGSLN